MRTDRKTGEPILSPRLSADQLHAMANDPGWRPWMRLIAEHPNAWPGLVDWWRTAQEQGFDTAGAAPEPPESMRGRRRVAIPAAPLPPENGGGPEDATADPDDGPEPVPATPEEEPAAEPAPSTPEPEEEGDATPRDAEPDRREEPEPETMREALDDADGDFAALEQVADTEPSTMDIPPLPEPVETEPPMDDGTDTDPFADVRVRRAIPWKAIGIIVAALIAVGLVIGGGVMLARRHGEETARWTLAQEAADCRQAHDTAGRQRDALEQAVEKARRLASATGKDQVADQSALDALDELADETIPELPSCPASNPDAGNVTAAGEEYKRRAEDLADAMDKVNRSILDKTVQDAKKLHDESAGKVADEQTRTDLAKAMDSRDADAIRKAMDKVNQSIKAKEDADKAKEEEEARAQAEAQAAQQQAQQPQQSRQSTPSTGGRTYGGATGKTTTPTPSTPSAPSAPTPQPAPSTPSKPSGTDGATVG